MRLPFFAKSSTEYTLLDFETQKVSASILSQDKEGEIKVLGRSSQRLPQGSILGRHLADLESLLEFTQTSLQSARLAAGKKPTSTIVLTSGQTVAGVGLKVRVKRAEPQKTIDQKEFDWVMERLEKETEDRAKEKAAQKFSGEANLRFLGLEVTQLNLDGAKVATPLSMPGSVLEVMVLYRFVEGTQFGLIEGLLKGLDLKFLSLWDKSLLLSLAKIEENTQAVFVCEPSRTTLTISSLGKMEIQETYDLGLDQDFWGWAAQVALGDFAPLLTKVRAFGESIDERKLKDRLAFLVNPGLAIEKGSYDQIYSVLPEIA